METAAEKTLVEISSQELLEARLHTHTHTEHINTHTLAVFHADALFC